MSCFFQPCTPWIVSFLFAVIHLSRTAHCHGIVTDPRQRGALVVRNRLVGDIDSSAPFDPGAHFPAGDKNSKPGSGNKSVRRAAGNHWTPYEPLNPGFKWRAGVCGDELGKDQEHLHGGKYFYPSADPTRTGTYHQGDIIDFETNIVAHHNGYFEFYICNIDSCGIDISVNCFREGHCERLLRAPSYCDEARSEDCGPIDARHRGRWYLPCGPFPKGQVLYGGKEKGSMKYKLPEHLICDHCVIQWYWTSANTCNPPDVREYFEGSQAPNWNDCRGQGGAVGGFAGEQRQCEGDNFPEEYWQCSDVRILPTAPSPPEAIPHSGMGSNVQLPGEISSGNVPAGGISASTSASASSGTMSGSFATLGPGRKLGLRKPGRAKDEDHLETRKQEGNSTDLTDQEPISKPSGAGDGGKELTKSADMLAEQTGNSISKEHLPEDEDGKGELETQGPMPTLGLPNGESGSLDMSSTIPISRRSKPTLTPTPLPIRKKIESASS